MRAESMVSGIMHSSSLPLLALESSCINLSFLDSFLTAFLGLCLSSFSSLPLGISKANLSSAMVLITFSIIPSVSFPGSFFLSLSLFSSPSSASSSILRCIRLSFPPFPSFPSHSLSSPCPCPCPLPGVPLPCLIFLLIILLTCFTIAIAPSFPGLFTCVNSLSGVILETGFFTQFRGFSGIRWFWRCWAWVRFLRLHVAQSPMDTYCLTRRF